MTTISTDDVHRLAKLSSLQLNETEAESLRGDLEHILTYIEQLSELDVEGVEPTYQVTGLQNIWRDDVVDTYGISSDKLLDLAPASDAQQIKVPKVL